MTHVLIEVHKASPIGDADVADVEIRINKAIPKEWDSAQHAAMVYSLDAKRIVDGLTLALPQAVLDRAFAMLAQQRASLLRIPFQPPQQAGEAGDSGPPAFECDCGSVELKALSDGWLVCCGCGQRITHFPDLKKKETP